MTQVNSPQLDTSRLVFISHKDADSMIADVVRSFLTEKSGARVVVHQSSSAMAETPKVGRNLNSELKNALWNAKIVILIYTDPDQDWSYCMWECGVALQPDTPDKPKIILFQCGRSSPALFAEHVKVNVRDKADIQKFTNEFLTDIDFFPRCSDPTTRFQPNGKEVINAATEFFSKLEEVLPSGDSVEWPAYPFLQLELDLDHCKKMEKLSDLESRTAIVYNESRISSADKWCEQLFGMMTLPPNLSFKELTDSWRLECPNSASTWVAAVAKQVAAGSLWKFPPRIWEKMEGVSIRQRYSPVVTRVRKLPSRKCMQFDIYFFFEESAASVSGSPLGQ
jgi:hypothetical protein